MTRLGAMVRGFNQGFGRGVAGFSGGDAAEQAGYDSAMARETKLAQALAQIRGFDANAERDAALAAETRAKTDALARRPNLYRQQAALSAGVDVPTLDSFMAALEGKPTQVPMGPEAPDGSMGVGSAAFGEQTRGKLAQALQRFLPLAANTGDIKVDDWAKALGDFRTQDLGTDVLEGRRTPQQVGAAQAAVAGKPLFNSDANGAVLDLFGGKLATDNPMAGAQINLRTQQANQARAGAAENWAQAGRANAETKRINTAPAPEGAAQDDRSDISRRLGVPIAERDPWAGMSPKNAETFKRSLYTAADKKMNDFAEASAAARGMAQDAKRFVELQSGVSMQGPLAGRLPAVSSDAQEMDAITARITPQMRQPGSGATSDFDAKMFQMATVGRTKNEEANRAIAQGIVLNAQVTQEREQFMRDYMTVNGHLDGAERMWKRYADANPIFDPKSPKYPALNPRRVPYQQFFGGAAPAAGSPTQAPAQPPAAGGFKYLGRE